MCLHITPADWEEFHAKFTSASAWMTRRNLERELEFYRTHKFTIWNEWQRNRWNELEEWAKSVNAIERREVRAS